MTGFQNVLSGIEHFPKHVLEWVEGGNSALGDLLDKALTEVVAYEKAHGKEQLDVAISAGKAGFAAARAAGKTVGDSIVEGVKAFFESAATEIKTLSTQAATLVLSAAAK